LQRLKNQQVLTDAAAAGWSSMRLIVLIVEAVIGTEEIRASSM
jgi:hypothetical protein